MIVGLVMVLAESQVFIRIEFDEMVGPEGVARAGGGRAVVVVALCGLLVRVDWCRKALWRSRLVVSAWRGPRIWLRQKQRSCDVWIASLGMGMFIM